MVIHCSCSCSTLIFFSHEEVITNVFTLTSNKANLKPKMIASLFQLRLNGTVRRTGENTYKIIATGKRSSMMSLQIYILSFEPQIQIQFREVQLVTLDNLRPLQIGFNTQSWRVIYLFICL